MTLKITGVEILGTPDTLPVSEVVMINVGRRLIYLDELPDGTWRLVYSDNMESNFGGIEGLRMVREEV